MRSAQDHRDPHKVRDLLRRVEIRRCAAHMCGQQIGRRHLGPRIERVPGKKSNIGQPPECPDHVSARREGRPGQRRFGPDMRLAVVLGEGCEQAEKPRNDRSAVIVCFATPPFRRGKNPTTKKVTSAGVRLPGSRPPGDSLRSGNGHRRLTYPRPVTGTRPRSAVRNCRYRFTISPTGPSSTGASATGTSPPCANGREWGQVPCAS